MAGTIDFTDGPAVLASHLLTVQSDRRNGDRQLARELLGVGIVRGLTLNSTAPESLAGQVTPGYAYNVNGQRLGLDEPVAIDWSHDNTTGTAVATAPPSGQTRWVSIVLRPGSETVLADTGAGEPFDRVNETTRVLVVGGAAAAPGAAVLPALQAGDVLLGSVLLTSTTTAVRGRDISFENVVRSRTANDAYAAAKERQLEPSPTMPPSLRVRVAAGIFYIDGEQHWHSGTLMPMEFVPDATRYCTGLLFFRRDGTIDVDYGPLSITLEGATRPTTVGRMPLAFVTLRPAATAIFPEDIVDARPWFRLDTSYLRTFVYPVVGSSASVVTLPFGFTADQIQVFVDGSLLNEDASYTVSVSTRQITFVTPVPIGQTIRVDAIQAGDAGGIHLAQIAEKFDGLIVGGTVTVENRGAGLRAYIAPISRLFLSQGSWTQDAEAFISGAGLPVTSFRYLYATFTATPGVLSFVLSAQEPDDSLTYMGNPLGAPNRNYRFLAALRTDASGNLLPGTFTPREARYEPSDRPLADFEVAYSATTAGAPMSVSAFAPPFARRLRLEAKAVGLGGGTGLVLVRKHGATGAYTVAASSPSGEMWNTCEIGCDANQVVDTDLSSMFLSAGDTKFYVRGWYAR